MCPLKGQCVPHVHPPSKVTGAIFLQWCEVAIVSKIHLSFHAGVVIYGLILSLTTDIMYISVFPGFWKWIPMICMQELLMIVPAFSVDSPSM